MSKEPCFIGTRTMYNSKRSRIITGNDNVPVKTNRQKQNIQLKTCHWMASVDLYLVFDRSPTAAK